MVYRIANIPLDYSVRFCKVSDKLTIFVVVTRDLFPFKASSEGIVHKLGASVEISRIRNQ